jgi:hypothetical protein
MSKLDYSELGSRVAATADVSADFTEFYSVDQFHSSNRNGYDKDGYENRTLARASYAQHTPPQMG